MALKGVRIGRDLDSFLKEHDEITLIRKNGKIVGVRATNSDDDIIMTSICIIAGDLFDLSYIYNDNYFHYFKR